MARPCQFRTVSRRTEYDVPSPKSTHPSAKKWLGAIFLIIAGLTVPPPSQAQPVAGSVSTTKVETEVATLTLRTSSFDLMGVAWKEPKEELIQEPRLGENFRLLLPRPGYQAAYLNSRDQSGVELTPAPDGVRMPLPQAAIKSRCSGCRRDL